MIKNLHQLKNTLNECQGTWAWVGQRGIDALTVSDFVPINVGFCCDFGEAYDGLRETASLFSVEKGIDRRENWGNQDLEKLWEPPIRERIETFLGDLKTPINTVCYRSLDALEKDRRFHVLAPALKLKDLFDDKLRQVELFSRLGVKMPSTFVCRLGETTFSKAGDLLDGPFVVQPPVGSSGDNTYFVNSETDFDRVRGLFGPAQRVKLSKYLPVPSLNGHCVVLKPREGLRAIAACPSVQVVGAHGCTGRAEVYCGNDFSAAGNVPKSLREEICTIMEKVGFFMGTQGFLGLFGMDFLISDDEVLALEINPRFQGSTMLLSLLQTDRGEIPLAALHVMQFMGLVDAFSREFLDQLKGMYRTPYTGAHLVVHSLKAEPCRIEHDLKAGIYTLVDDAIQWVREGTTYREIDRSNAWCVLGNLPRNSTEIRQEARLAMIQSRESVLDRINLRQLDSDAAAFVDRLQRRCRMIPLNGGSA
ncbi:MAG: ATP-grasp domain-containing protein [Deltaproteobacteria bacterium]|nr:ATP-grasp domain-containing protein [Deltaproteobacteria bacterium]